MRWGGVLTSDLAWNAVSPFRAAIDISEAVEMACGCTDGSPSCSETVLSADRSLYRVVMCAEAEVSD